MNLDEPLWQIILALISAIIFWLGTLWGKIIEVWKNLELLKKFLGALLWVVVGGCLIGLGLIIGLSVTAIAIVVIIFLIIAFIISYVWWLIFGEKQPEKTSVHHF